MSVSLCLFYVVAIIASWLGVNFHRSLLGNYYRADGLLVLLQLVCFAFALGLNIKNIDRYKLAMSIFVSGIFSSIWNNFGQPNYLVGFLLVTIPFGFYILAQSENLLVKLFTYLGISFSWYVIYTLDSYVGLFGAFAAPVILILFANRSKVSKLLLIPLLIGLSVTIYSWYGEIANKPEYVAESRFRIYRNLFVAGLNRPVLGYGWSNVDYAFKGIEWPMKFNDDIYVDRAHMLFLDIFINTGLIGLAVYIVFLITLFINVAKNDSAWRVVILISLVMYLIHSQTNITSISQDFTFWLIVGLNLLSF
jgi:hypothetical protein